MVRPLFPGVIAELLILGFFFFGFPIFIASTPTPPLFWGSVYLFLSRRLFFFSIFNLKEARACHRVWCVQLSFCGGFCAALFFFFLLKCFCACVKEISGGIGMFFFFLLRSHGGDGRCFSIRSMFLRRYMHRYIHRYVQRGN